jgi:pyruvate dehydrogenase E2 component (dihydrolipoamide acetyltransferase)
LQFLGRLFASPLAKTLATAANLSLSEIQGSGPNSRIVKADVERAVAQGVSAKPTKSVSDASQVKSAALPISEHDTPFKESPLSNMRKVIAARLSESKSTIPHYYLTAEISMDRALKLREVLNQKLLEGSVKDAKVSVNDLVVKASALALKEVPDVNAAWWPQTNSIRLFQRADISVAVATESGLITPIVRAAENKGLASISREVRSLAGKAKANKLQPHEFQGGSFTISNLGMFGSISQFTAIINPPQAAILAVGGLSEKIIRSPTEENQFVAEQVMKVTLSCDHRVVDGALGAKWLASFKKFMEEPLQMML